MLILGMSIPRLVDFTSSMVVVSAADPSMLMATCPRAGVKMKARMALKRKIRFWVLMAQVLITYKDIKHF
jgi:hypothetical protein